MAPSTVQMLLYVAAMCLLTALPSVSATRSVLAMPTAGKYKQCGGAGGDCSGSQCKDAAWATCPSGFKCYRISQWYRTCDTHQPKPTPAPPLPPNAYKQCGGSGNGCTGTKCGDRVWPGFTCPTGYKCYRVSQYYRQCDTAPIKPTPPKPNAPGAYTQCGGSGNGCKGSKCGDRIWPGATCPKGFMCERVSKYYWQCDTHKLS